MSIPFIQFVAPHGRKRNMVIDMPEDVEEKARKVLVAGGVFTAEMLSTGIVSLACEFEGEDIAGELSQNDEMVVEKVKDLVDASFAILQQKGIVPCQK
jgi:hypothetical protein